MSETSKTLSQINISESILAILAIVFGILIIAFPWLISYIIGVFLIVEGILLLIKYVEKQRRSTNER
ncbi:MAG: DUF3096 domain-containing protein [Promethearchaeota archaeon]